MRHFMLATSLFAVATFASAGAGQSASTKTGPGPDLQVQAKALDTTPESRIEADAAMDGAVAAAVIGAVAQEFGEREVGVKLDRVQVDPASVRDRAVSGEGRLQLGGEGEWIGFRYAANYDTQTSSVMHPQLVIGADGAGEDIAQTSPIARTLLADVTRRMRGEFDSQPFEVSFDRIRTLQAGARYLRVEAIGLADFRGEGTTPASAQGLYDTRTRNWVKVNYELGTTANWAETQVAAL